MKPRLIDIKPFVGDGDYSVNVSWTFLEEWLESYREYGELDVDPDFQRDHVWTPEKEERYVEYVLRQGRSSRTLYWNHPTHLLPGRPSYTGDLPQVLVLVDGKQRLKAVRGFLSNKVRAFGYLLDEYEEGLKGLRLVRHDFVMNVNTLRTRRELLQWYLDLNSGGTVHTPGELEKVRRMLKECK